MDWDEGEGLVDAYVDLPPYRAEPEGRAAAERLEPHNIGAQWQDLLVRLRDRGPEEAAP
jgi:hypothetical protein